MLKRRDGTSPNLGFSKAKLDALVDEAIVDAYGDDEQRVGLRRAIPPNRMGGESESTPFPPEPRRRRRSGPSPSGASVTSLPFPCAFTLGSPRRSAGRFPFPFIAVPESVWRSRVREPGMRFDRFLMPIGQDTERIE